jgi:hypothetical protein
MNEEEEIIEAVEPVPNGDMYVKIADEAQSIEVLEGYQGSVDVIGVIYTVDNTDPENPVATPLDGWHVNTRGPITLELEAFSVHPAHPRRVWA